MTATEKLADWYAMGPFGFIAVDADRVNLDDMIEAYGTPGAIVRVMGSPSDAIMVMPADTDPLGCVAGWISENE